MEPYYREEEKPQLIIDDYGKADLLETARWAKFLSILGFVFMGFYLLGGIALVSAVATSPELGAVTKTFGATGIVFLYAILGFIMIYPIYAQYLFSLRIKPAIKNTDSAKLNEAFRYLKNLYKYYGIIALIMIGFYGLVFVIMLIVGAVAG